MTWNSKRLPRTLALLMVIAALGPGTRSARAQYGTGMGMGMGMGIGMGMGMGGFHYASSPTDYLNQRARLNATHAARRPPRAQLPAIPTPITTKSEMTVLFRTTIGDSASRRRNDRNILSRWKTRSIASRRLTRPRRHRGPSK